MSSSPCSFNFVYVYNFCLISENSIATLSLLSITVLCVWMGKLKEDSLLNRLYCRVQPVLDIFTIESLESFLLGNKREALSESDHDNGELVEPYLN